MKELANRCLSELEDTDLMAVDADDLEAEVRSLYDKIGEQAINPDVDWDAFTELLRGVVYQSFRLKRVRDVQEEVEHLPAEA